MKLPVYQFILELPGINTKVPEAFAVKPKVEPRLTKTLAYYVALATAFDAFLPGDDAPGSVLWLWYTADDLEANEKHYPDARPSFKTFGAEKGLPIDKQIDYYCDLAFAVKWDLAEHIWEKHLDPFWNYFERGQYGMLWQRPLPALREKLRTEWPDVHQQFKLNGR